MYVIVDIETTGSYSSQDGITEIGAVLTDGEKVMDEFHTLVNPGSEIPNFITTLTGIDNNMLDDAPFFEEIEEELFSFLDGNIFVAHNVQFDYNFIRNAFELQGRKYQSKRLCTVRLSRKLIPIAPGYSLSKITRFLGIENERPHRALGDARATTKLFFELIKRDQAGVIEGYLKSNSHETILPLNVNKDDFKSLPQKAGVYYFIDEKGKIIYIGKAKNLKKRVSSHFSGKPESRRRHHFHTEIFKIDHEVTGSELIASLREDELIRKYWPKYNRAQKNRVVQYGIYLYKDQSNCSRLGIQKTNANGNAIKKFYSMWESRNWLMEKVQEFNLEPEKCGLPVFLNENSTKRKHENGIKKLVLNIEKEEQSFLLIENGRDRHEKAIVWIEKDDYKGFGFVSREEQVTNKSQLETLIQNGNSSVTSRSIISGFIERSNPEIVFL